jgi:hypothetical protein
MSDNLKQREIETLEEELRSYREEKEKIRNIIGRIGGTQSVRRSRIINIAFITVLLGLLVLDVLRHVLDSMDWLPSLVSLEVGILLVSIKIIWMIHKQAKVEHFQFWILNSIEFRLNEVAKRLSGMEKNQQD